MLIISLFEGTFEVFSFILVTRTTGFGAAYFRSVFGEYPQYVSVDPSFCIGVIRNKVLMLSPRRSTSDFWCARDCFLGLHEIVFQW